MLQSKRIVLQYCLGGGGGGQMLQSKRPVRTSILPGGGQMLQSKRPVLQYCLGGKWTGRPPTNHLLQGPIYSLQFLISHYLYLCAGGQFFIIHYQWMLYTQGTTVIKSGHVMVLKAVEAIVLKRSGHHKLHMVLYSSARYHFTLE